MNATKLLSSLVLLVLTACVPVISPPAVAPTVVPSTATPELSASAGSLCDAGFRRFDHELLATDPICIPENPQRIAFIDSTIAYGIALGVE